jgi:hypothetical protein
MNDPFSASGSGHGRPAIGFRALFLEQTRCTAGAGAGRSRAGETVLQSHFGGGEFEGAKAEVRMQFALHTRVMAGLGPAIHALLT